MSLGLKILSFLLIKQRERARKKLLFSLEISHRDWLCLLQSVRLDVRVCVECGWFDLTRHFDCAGRHEVSLSIFDPKYGSALCALFIIRSIKHVCDLLRAVGMSADTLSLLLPADWDRLVTVIKLLVCIIILAQLRLHPAFMGIIYGRLLLGNPVVMDFVHSLVLAY